MKMRSLWTAVGAGCLVLAATGCNLQAGAAGPQTWIDAPLDGSTLPLGPVIVRSHAASEGGTVQAALLVNGAQVRVDQAADGSAALIEFVQNWTPGNPGDYVLQVVSTDQGGNPGHSNMVHVHIGDLPITFTPTAEIAPLPIIPPPPTFTPTATATATAIGGGGPSFAFDKNANCREGPSQVFNAVTAFLSGQTVVIEGRNEDSTWFYVRIPGDGVCWVSAVTGAPSGPYANTPVIASPVLPPLAAPGKFNVENVQCDAGKYVVGLSWGDVGGEEGYYVYRDEALIATNSADETSFNDTPPDYSPHKYRVEAFNAGSAASTGSKASTGCVY